MAPTVGEKGVALKVDETAASHLTPLHIPEDRADLHPSTLPHPPPFATDTAI